MMQPGARIAVVAPAGIFDADRLKAGEEVVRSWGFEVVEEPDLFARHRYTAGTLVQRARGLSWALTEPGIDAVWFARGGYGTAGLLDLLPWDSLDDRPVIGFSDATALFCAMRARGSGRGLHGPVLYSLADHVDEASRVALRRALSGGSTVLRGELVSGPQDEVVGRVVGGNLSLLASLCGTPWALRARGCILVIEDVGEPPYRIDRMLTQLVASGALDGVRGVALGEFTGCEPPAGAGWSLLDVVVDALDGFAVPVVAGLPVGHGVRNHAWVVGARGRLHPGGLDVAAR